MAVAMRGLTMFIGDIRNCKTKEAEQQRVDKELAHIRQKFTSKSGLDGYGKKKYVWKLLYIYMLGYEVDVGHMEALQMIASPKYTEKSTGYLACSILLNETHQLLRLIIQQVKNDLNSKNEIFQCLALSVVANVGGQEFAESLTNDVQKLLIAPTSRAFVKKKGSLSLLRLFRKYPEVIPQDDFCAKIVPLLDDPALGVGVCSASLLLGVVSQQAAGNEIVVEKGVGMLYSLRFQRERYPDYKYYHTINPWLQVKLLRCLQYFPPPANKQIYQKLHDVLDNILTKTEVTKSVNKNNADHGILFEAINLIIHHCVHGQMDLHGQAVGLLGRFISVREPNIRYLGLETMSRLTRIPKSLPQIRTHQQTIQVSLKDPDISIRKRALDVLYAMCDKSNVVEIVDELLKYLEKADFLIKEELVLKIAILAEKYAKDLRWYIDCILQLITIAGNFVSDDIWFRVVQIVTNNEDLQDYAATTVFKLLQSSSIHESGIKVGGYILGEFGHQIKDESITGEMMFDVLYKRFTTANTDTKALLLSAFIKMANTYPELKARVEDVFKKYRDSIDVELQQRAIEYSTLNSAEREELMNSVFEMMPNFSERESALEKRIKKVNKETTDRDVWSDEKDKKKEKEDGDEDEEEEEDEDEETQASKTKEDDDDEDEKADTRKTDGLDDEEEPPRKTAAAGQVDLFGFDSGNTPVQASAMFPAQDASKLAKLVGKQSGVVYESDDLQIGVKIMPGNTSQCKMILYYGNKGQRDLSNVVIETDENFGYRAQVKPASVDVPAGKQIPHYILWTAYKPETDFPSIDLTITCGGRTERFTVKLPVILPHFVEPTAVDSASFIATWKANTVQAQEVVKCSQAYEVQELKDLTTAAAQMALIDGVEKDENNFSFVGRFHTATKGGDGENLVVPVLLRFETKPNNKFVRVTARSPNQSVSDTLLHAVKLILGAGK